MGAGEEGGGLGVGGEGEGRGRGEEDGDEEEMPMGGGQKRKQPTYFQYLKYRALKLCNRGQEHYPT